MSKPSLARWCALALMLGGVACSDGRERIVDHARLVSADRETGQWLTHGRTYDEQRFSPLTAINDRTVSQLGLAWYADLDTRRGQEATPLMVDGVLYITTAWSKVKAYDAKSGAPLWAYDPEVPRETLVNACCDAVNRGVAFWNGRVFVGTLDGRLIALDAKTGKPAWSVVTVDQTKPYTITGAPRVIKGKVIIGNGGAEYGVRGYVSAYDAQTGALAWRFYTVPGDPKKPDGAASDAVLKAKAVRTWSGEWWKLGGGATVWDSMAYDPELDLLYVGTGNGSPWNPRMRSPKGGDNLFLSSVLALRPETGAYVWHYQETPNEAWDYTATQHLILADLTIDGARRKVLMHAPKNGFFYVIDRKTGALISAKPYATVNWAKGVDLKTGRPIENPASRYYLTGKPWTALPGPTGAHNWQPMSFNPQTGLVYIPQQDAGFLYVPDKSFGPYRVGMNLGVDFAAATVPPDPKSMAAAKKSIKGAIVAWDPVAQKEVFRVQHNQPSNGGILTTAGNLLLQGDALGNFAIYRADNGQRLWSMPVQTGVIAPPMTYEIGGEQYIAVLAGWGGAWGLPFGELAHFNGPPRNISRLLVFKLGATKSLPPIPAETALPLDPPPLRASHAAVEHGAALFGRFCTICHGMNVVASGLVPDLRYSALLGNEAWFDVVLKGTLKDQGMVAFANVLDRKAANDIRDYVIQRANEDKAGAEVVGGTKH